MSSSDSQHFTQNRANKSITKITTSYTRLLKRSKNYTQEETRYRPIFPNAIVMTSSANETLFCGTSLDCRMTSLPHDWQTCGPPGTGQHSLSRPVIRTPRISEKRWYSNVGEQNKGAWLFWSSFFLSIKL